MVRLQDVAKPPLHKSERPYRVATPGSLTCDDEQRRRWLAALNKITLGRAGLVAQRLAPTALVSELLTQQFAAFLVEKAWPEPLFAPAYAALCLELHSLQKDAGLPLILFSDVKALLNSSTKRTVLGAVHFLGALTNARVVPAVETGAVLRVWLDAVQPVAGTSVLTCSSDTSRETKLEASCRLLTLSGEALGSAADEYVARFAQLTQVGLTNRLRFLVENTLLFAFNGWRKPAPAVVVRSLPQARQRARRPTVLPRTLEVDEQTSRVVPVPADPMPADVAELQAQLASVRLELDKIRSCVVCFEAPKAAVLVPCHHFALCIACSNKLLATPSPRCPVCRLPTDAAIRCFVV